MDITELKRLASEATPGPHHIYTHPRDDNNWEANKAWQEAASPQVFMELIELNAELLAALCMALPFVEDHEGSDVYKSGAVKEAIAVIRNAIAKAEDNT